MKRLKVNLLNLDHIVLEALNNPLLVALASGNLIYAHAFLRAFSLTHLRQDSNKHLRLLLDSFMTLLLVPSLKFTSLCIE